MNRSARPDDIIRQIVDTRSGVRDIQVARLEERHFVGDANTGLGTAFANGWTNLDSTRPHASFYRDADWVYLEGVVINSAGTGGSGAIFTLPVDYRVDDGKEHWIPVFSDGGTATKVEITSAGVVNVPALSSAGARISLDGVRFRAR